MAFRAFREFIRLETSGGILLFFTAMLALIISNTPWDQYYDALFNMPIVISIGVASLSKTLLHWVNDGLMAIFFLLVGLEVKREFLIGELNSAKKCVLPGVAAVGGMAIPALIYIIFNWGDMTAIRGWAIPSATDIAFSLGILSLLGRHRIPVSLKVFLTALAIFDDIGAIAIIAVFYTKQISVSLLFLALALTLLLFLMNRLHVRKLSPYLIVGFALWLCVLNSGIHATLAGILVAFAIPMHDAKNPHRSPLIALEKALHPWVAFFVLPVFAFANAGVSFAGLTAEEIFSPITLGIASGLFFGKQIGIWGASWLAVKFGFAHKPRGADFTQVYGISLIAGVGFTMSLFIGSLAFNNGSSHYAAMVRMGVIAGSFASGILGYLVLRYHHNKRTKLGQALAEADAS